MKGNRQALEKLFYFSGPIRSPTSCILARELFQIFHGPRVPTPKSFYDERDEMNSLGTAVGFVSAVFGKFTSFNRRVSY